MKVLRTYRTGGPISSSARVAYLAPDEGATILACSDGLYAWEAGSGRLRPGFPVFGKNFFASRPLIADLFGDGRRAILVGNDDNHLYGFDETGRPMNGFPVRTSGDVYSSPAVDDLDGDGVQEIVVGSDDGYVYVLRADGSAVAGWPRKTDGFVSASPVIADLDGDGCREVLAGSWDCHVYAWRSEGSLFPGWPQLTGQPLWSSPCVADLDGDGNLEVIAASDQVYAWCADGSMLTGWPRPVGSHVVAQPVVADIDGDGRHEVLVAADALYAWHPDGSTVSGFPRHLGPYFWSAPVVRAVHGAPGAEIILGGWNGRLYVLGPDGNVSSWPIADRPIFAAPVLMSPQDEDRRQSCELLISSWDGNLYMVGHDPERTMAQEVPFNKPSAVPACVPAGSLKVAPEGVSPFVTFEDPPTSHAIMYYQALGEDGWHPVPLVVHQGQLTGLFQPFPAGTTVSFWAEIDGRRRPESGTFGYTVTRNLQGRARRKLRRRLALASRYGGSMLGSMLRWWHV